MASLAKSIRAADEHQDIDLANYTQAQVVDLFNAAFSEPLPSTKMLRFTFTVGGGKKVRQKYGDDLPKYCREALRTLGFEEDRGASACLECAQTYKYQHDTDKDLKFIHVFPRIDPAASTAGKGASDEQEEEITVAGIKLEELPPDHLCTIVSMDTFLRLVASQCPSFSQRRFLLKAMKEMASKFKGFEERMTSMQPLLKEEDELYNSAQFLHEKIAELEKQLEGMVEGGHLTKTEISTMISELNEKIQQVDEMITKQKETGKKTTKLEETRATMAAKVERLKAATPAVHRRKNDREIQTLRKQLRDLEAIENSKTLVSLEEMKKLNQKPNILARIAQLEAESRGWYDDSIPKEDRLQDKPAGASRAAEAPANRGWETSAPRRSGGGGGGGGAARKSANSNPWGVLSSD